MRLTLLRRALVIASLTRAISGPWRGNNGNARGSLGIASVRTDPRESLQTAGFSERALPGANVRPKIAPRRSPVRVRLAPLPFVGIPGPPFEAALLLQPICNPRFHDRCRKRPKNDAFRCRRLRRVVRLALDVHAGARGARNLPAVLGDPLEVQGDRGSHLALDVLEAGPRPDAAGKVGRPGGVVGRRSAVDQDQVALGPFGGTGQRSGSGAGSRSSAVASTSPIVRPGASKSSTP